MPRRPVRPPRRSGRLAPWAEALPGLSRRLGAPPELAWVQAAGARLARRTAVLSLRDGTLRIAVPDTAWARHLDEMASRLKPRVQAAFGRGRVDRIRFEVAPARLPPPEAPSGPRPTGADPPLDLDDLRRVREGGVQRPALAEAIARAMAAHRGFSDGEA